MKLKLYTDDRLSYGTKNVYKYLKDDMFEISTIDINRFNYGDMINSSVILEEADNIPIRDLTYIILINNKNEEFHYYITGITFISHEKYELTLYRNSWYNLDISDIEGKIERGYDNNTIASYKPNTISVNERKIGEIPIYDDFWKYYRDEDKNVTPLWGYLFMNQSITTDTVVHFSDIETGSYMPIPEEIEDNKKYFHKSYFYGDEDKIKIEGFRPVIIQQKSARKNESRSGNSTTIKFYYLKDSIKDIYIKNYRTGDYRMMFEKGIITGNDIEVKTFNIEYNSNVVGSRFDNNKEEIEDWFNTKFISNEPGNIKRPLLYQERPADHSNPKTFISTEKAANHFNLRNIYRGDGDDIKTGYEIYNEGLGDLYIGSELVSYKNEQIVNNLKGTYVLNNILKEVDVVKDKRVDEVFKTDDKELEFDGKVETILKNPYLENPPDDYYNNLEMPTQFKIIDRFYIESDVKRNLLGYATELYIWLKTNLVNKRININFTHTGENIIDYSRFIVTDSYIKDDNDGFGITAEDIRNSGRLLEPYGIMAMPLFDIKWRLVDDDNTPIGDNQITESNRMQLLFYNLIAQHSGDNALISDAQIMPYGPPDYMNRLSDDGYVHIKEGTNSVFKKLKTDGITGEFIIEDDDFETIPIIPISTSSWVINRDIDFSNISSNDTIPSNNIQKDYTMRKYRLIDPSQSAGYDFNYYDYAGDYGIKDSKLSATIAVTLKPFGSYMHARIKPNHNSLVAKRDFEDITGLIAPSSIYAATMTSNAFETYKRQNASYEAIQDRVIGSMSINHEAERKMATWEAAISTAQTTALGTIAGASMGGSTVVGKSIGGAAGGVASGVITGLGYAQQKKANDELRQREIDDSKFYYQSNLSNIKAMPDSLNRVSEINADILKKFVFFIEVYEGTREEFRKYDDLENQIGKYLDTNGRFIDYINDGCYITGKVFKTNIKPEIQQGIKNDLERGIYYYDKK